jgi:S1-C subfamily serine protease
MKTDISNAIYSIVRIHSQNIDIDKKLPYKINDISEGIGTGFFYDFKGYLITCFHVVMQSRMILVEIPAEGFKKYPAYVVGICPDFDLAILHVPNYKPIKVLELEKKYKNIQGEDVEAIGFPLGQDTVKITKGIVSGKTFGVIQTDTPLNPGNSGGPLMYQNKVVGINNAVMAGSSNIGFAIPIQSYYLIRKNIEWERYETFLKNILLPSLLENKKNISISSRKKLKTKLKTKTKFISKIKFKNTKMNFIKKFEHFYNPSIINRPILGILHQTTNEALLDLSKSACTQNAGILINYIHPLSPIHLNSKNKKKQMEKGDIICKINGIGIDENGLLINPKKELLQEKISFKDYLRTLEYGNTIIFDYCHSGKINKIQFKYEYREYPVRLRMPIYEKIDYEIILGMCFMNLSINLLIEMDKIEEIYNSIKEEKHKVVVSFIFPVSYTTSSNNFEEGDIIEYVNGHKVDSLDDFRKYFRKYLRINGEDVILLENDKKQKLAIYLQDIFKNEMNLQNTYNYPEQPLWNIMKKKNYNHS